MAIFLLNFSMDSPSILLSTFFLFDAMVYGGNAVKARRENEVLGEMHQPRHKH